MARLDVAGEFFCGQTNGASAKRRRRRTRCESDWAALGQVHRRPPGQLANARVDTVQLLPVVAGKTKLAIRFANWRARERELAL